MARSSTIRRPPAGNEKKMAELSDKDFVTLARKAGYPTEEQLKKARKEQLERAKKGEKAPLFAWAKAQGGLTAEQVHRFERWAEQIAAKKDEPIEEESEDDAATGKKKKRRKIHESAAHFAVPPAKCETCGQDLDSVAVMEERAREVDGKIVCAVCPAESKPEAKPGTKSAARPAPAPAGTKSDPSKRPIAPPPVKPITPPPPVAAKPTAEPAATDAAPQAKRKKKKISDALKESARQFVAKVKRKKPDGAQPAPSGGKAGLLILAFGAATVGALVVVALVFAFKEDKKDVVASPSPSPTALASASPAPSASPTAAPSAAPSPKAKASESPATSGEKKPTGDDLARALASAEKLEQDGREADALALLDGAITKFRDVPGKEGLQDAKVKMLLRLKDRLDAERAEIKRLALGNDFTMARERIAKLRARFPKSLEPDIGTTEKEIDAIYADNQAREEKERAAAADEAKKKDALAAYAPTKIAIDKALAILDTAAAKTALAAAPQIDDKAVQDLLALDKKRIGAIEQLIEFTAEGFKSDIKQDVELQMRSGPKVKGKLLRVEGDKLALDALGGEIAVSMGDLTPKFMLLSSRRGAKKKIDEFNFAKGVLLAVTGDKKGAIEALEQAATIAEAEQLRKNLKAEEGSGSEPTVAQKPEKPSATKPPKKTDESKPDKPESKPDKPSSGNGDQGDPEDERIQKALAQKLHVPATVKNKVAVFEYSFTTEDQLQDWKVDGFDVAECGSSHDVVSLALAPGLLLGASSRGPGVMSHCLKLKGDFEIEVKMVFNQMTPSGNFVTFFGEKSGKSTGVSFGQQLVKVGASGGIHPLNGPEPDRAKWGAEKIGTYRIVRKNDIVEVFMNGARTASAKGDFDGKIGFLALGIRAVIENMKIKGTIDPSQL